MAKPTSADCAKIKPIKRISASEVLPFGCIVLTHGQNSGQYKRFAFVTLVKTSLTIFDPPSLLHLFTIFYNYIILRVVPMSKVTTSVTSF